MHWRFAKSLNEQSWQSVDRWSSNQYSNTCCMMLYQAVVQISYPVGRGSFRQKCMGVQWLCTGSMFILSDQTYCRLICQSKRRCLYNFEILSTSLICLKLHNIFLYCKPFIQHDNFIYNIVCFAGKWEIWRLVFISIFFLDLSMESKFHFYQGQLYYGD